MCSLPLSFMLSAMFLIIVVKQNQPNKQKKYNEKDKLLKTSIGLPLKLCYGYSVCLCLNSNDLRVYTKLQKTFVYLIQLYL